MQCLAVNVVLNGLRCVDEHVCIAPSLCQISYQDTGGRCFIESSPISWFRSATVYRQFQLFDYCTRSCRVLDGAVILTRISRAFSPWLCLQGGDVQRNVLPGADTSPVPSFNDESFELKHVGPGILTMANAGR